MLLMLFNLFQAQSQGLSWIIWAIVILIFVAGLSLLIYFFTRLKKTEKEAEEEWSLSTHSLFADVAPGEKQPAPQATEEEQADAIEAPALEDETRELVSSPAPTEQARAKSSDESFPITAQARTETAQEQVVSEPEPIRQQSDQGIDQEISREQSSTQLLVSSQPETAATEPQIESQAADEPTPFDDEIWAELESHEEKASPVANRFDQTAQPREPELEEAVEPTDRTEIAQMPRDARIERHSHREPFVAPSIEPINNLQPYEPPSIEPIVPGERPTQREPIAPEPVNEPVIERAPKFDSAPAPVDTSEPAVAARSEAGRVNRRVGTVLGLPAESSDAPLALGEPVRRSGDEAIDSLSSYGKDTSVETGQGGTIALVVAILLVGGVLLAYLYMPPFKLWVDDLVARVRLGSAIQSTRQPTVEKPRARIFPVLSPEVNKNQVKARGAVDNISEETLEGLSVEVSLERIDKAPAETRAVKVSPEALAPRQRGTYEFEYDGKQYTGYRITKLRGKDGSEIKFATPNQNR